ncbi:hypothetical protein KTN05_10745 [Paracoccus sp. Z118]|uniref:hypothetical protein n=1 Tax=Paracoccus sp. Z118 TaxID=2851017 RepID=UPI001C2C056B|nr:hypothetical protein [Paracoccus sp. Z118]MBV0892328.1 hypothetical protein [Paracoccus sp. Z118]
MQTKSFVRIAGALLLAGGLSACAQTGYYGGTGLSPDAQRAAGGALAGAVVAKALDEKVATGALIGAAGGALCDDVGVCQ